jgi:hypothetical protein
MMDGYNQLAGIMGAEPELAIFRRFLALNARNVLCLEAEVLHLEDSLRRIILEDSRSDDDERRLFERDIHAMKEAIGEGGKGLQWKRTLEVRQILKEYSQSLEHSHSIYAALI